MAKKVDPREDNFIQPDIESMKEEFQVGKSIGEPSGIEQFDGIFSWKKTFVNVWMGWPGDGKTTLFFFMALMKIIKSDFKDRVCIWSPEMVDTRKGANGKTILSVNDILDELIFMYTGKNPFLHYVEQYNLPQIEIEEYVAAYEKLSQNLSFLHPRERIGYKDLFDNFKYAHEYYGSTIFLADPFKNLKHTEDRRGDYYIDDFLSEAKMFAQDTDSNLNIVAHAVGRERRASKEGAYGVVSPEHLNGGPSWDNGVDGAYSIHRPFRHDDQNDTRVDFWNLKQRKQWAVGKRGKVSGIVFDKFTHRYYFNEAEDKATLNFTGVCPIDGSKKDFKFETGAKPVHTKKKKAPGPPESLFNPADSNEAPF